MMRRTLENQLAVREWRDKTKAHMDLYSNRWPFWFWSWYAAITSPRYPVETL